MAAGDLTHPPEGVVLLPEPEDTPVGLSPHAWVETARREVPRRLRRPVAEHLADARDSDEV